MTQADKIAKKPVTEMSAIEKWVVFFAKANDPAYRDTLDKISEKKEGISVAYEMLTSISADSAFCSMGIAQNANISIECKKKTASFA